MLRPSPNHGTHQLPNDDDDDLDTILRFSPIVCNCSDYCLVCSAKMQKSSSYLILFRLTPAAIKAPL